MISLSTPQLGPIGIWTSQLDYQPAARAQEAAAELEQLGFRAIWLPEATGREALPHASLLLAGTRRIVVATGIANIYVRDPVAMAAAQNTLAKAYPDRFVLGLGVSHAPLVEQFRGHRYEKPVPCAPIWMPWTRRPIMQFLLPLNRSEFSRPLDPKCCNSPPREPTARIPTS